MEPDWTELIINVTFLIMIFLWGYKRGKKKAYNECAKYNRDYRNSPEYKKKIRNNIPDEMLKYLYRDKNNINDYKKL